MIHVNIDLKDKTSPAAYTKIGLGSRKQNATQNEITGDVGNICASQSVGVALTVTPLLAARSTELTEYHQSWNSCNETDSTTN